MVTADPQALAAAFAVISASTVGIIEAIRAFLPEGSKPIASIVVGAVLAILYIALPSEIRPMLLVILAGATGTAGVAVAQRLKPEPVTPVTVNFVPPPEA